MPLLKQGAVAPDPWRMLAEDAAPQPGETTLIPLAVWREHRERLLSGNGQYGVVLQPEDDVAEIAGDLARLDVVALTFPAFKDGRGFSQARLLRERHGYAGELRARGPVFRDQYLYLARCGIDAIEVEDETAVQDWQAAMQEFSIFFQPTGDGRRTVLAKRGHTPA